MNVAPKCSECGRQLESPDNGTCDSCRDRHAQTIAPESTQGEPADVDATVPPTPLTGSASPRTSNSFDSDFGEYELLEEIARGGMGVVYKARHRKLDRIAAIKMILSGKFSSQEEVQRFHIEAAAAAKLDHPGIVPVYEVGEEDGQAFFAMKYVDGGSLADRMDSLVGDPRKAVTMLAKVARAVHHAHQRGILHRDLKPANVLLDEDDQPLLTDLGLAKSTSGGSDLTNTGAVLGTPSYMPPEQASGALATTASDTYSLGAILYEMLTGQPPFKGETTIETVMQVLAGPPMAPSKIRPGVDRDLELICMKCLEREPELRYETASGLAEDLEAWLAGESLSIKPPTLGAVAGRWFRNNRKLVYVAFGLLAGVMFSFPFLLAFAGDEKDSSNWFPRSEFPLIFRFGKVPAWLGIGIVMLILFVFWPAIGYLNASLSDAKTVRGSLWQGLFVSSLFSLVLLPLLGWMVVLHNASAHTDRQIRTLADAVWASEENQEEAIRRANELFEGTDQIPIEERAWAVASRIRMAHMGSILMSVAIMFGVLLLFSIPIVYGTLFGAILKRRRTNVVFKIVRYFVGWWASMLALVFAIVLLATQIFGGDGPGPIPAAIVFSTTSLVVFLVLRRWRKDPEASVVPDSAQQAALS